MTGPMVQGLPHRSRRCALIPSGVKLTPEEELLIISRIGYHPIPPPDAGTLQCTATRISKERTQADIGIANEKHSCFNPSSDPWSVFDNGDDLVGIGLKTQIVWEEKQPAVKLEDYGQQGQTTDTDKSVRGASRKRAEHDGKSHTRATRPRRASWSVDIPHMSEIPPLNNRPSMVAMCSSDQGSHDSERSITDTTAGCV